MGEGPLETVAFWNCGLAPLGRDNPSNETYEAAGRTIRRLVQDGAKMLGLCEVNQESIERLSPFLPRRFSLRSCVEQDGRRRWDLALAYDRDVWEDSRSDVQLVARHGNHSYKAGWRRMLRHRSSGIKIAVYVAHWRSRLHDGALAREQCAMELGQRIAKEKCPVLLMGDFNDEPFDKAFENLNASRDIHLVRKSPRLLFNPFWRHLGYEDRHADRCGTYFHRNGETTRWRTFDQIIVSSEFLQDRGLCFEWAGPAPSLEDVGDHVPVRLDLHQKEIHHGS